jgi:signal transduction histidine kinase
MARIFIVICLSIAISLTGISQNIDSLRLLYKSHPPIDSSYILTAAELAYQMYSVKPDSSLMLAKQADSLAIALNFKKGEGRAKRVIGIYHWSKGDLTKAMQLFEKALHLAEQSDDQKGTASCLTNIGVVYRNKGNIGLAADYFFRSLKIRETIHDKQGIATTTNNLGLIFSSLRIYDKALENFEYSIRVANEIKDKSSTARAYLNRGRVFQTLSKYPQAIDSYQESLRLTREIGDQRGVNLACDNLANIFVSTKQFDKAWAMLNEGLTAALALRSKDRIADNKQEFANYYNATGNPTKAYQLASEGLAIAQEAGIIEAWKDALQQKYLAEEKLGMYKEALGDYSFFVKIRDSIRNEELTRATLSKEYDFKSDKLRVEQEKKELEHIASQERQKRMVNTFAGIAVTFVLISVLIFISNRKINHQKRELQNARQLIEKQNREISKRNETLEAEVNERTHELAEYNKQLEQFAFMSAHNLRAPVARILGLGNLLTLSPKKVEDNDLIVEKIISTTRELDEVVRDINTVLAQKNITSITTSLNITDEFRKIKEVLSKEIQEANPAITEDFSNVNKIDSVRSYFQSIFLNLLSNAMRFRDINRKLEIKLTTEVIQDYIVITCSDNGLGIDLSRFGHKLFNLYSRFHVHVNGKGIGLYLVKSQLTSLGGKIEVESKEGVGSTFKVYLKKTVT